MGTEAGTLALTLDGPGAGTEASSNGPSEGAKTGEGGREEREGDSRRFLFDMESWGGDHQF